MCVSFLVLLCQVVGSRSFLSDAEECSSASSPGGIVGELLVGGEDEEGAV